MKGPLKVAIGVPSNDMVHTDFTMCLINLCMYSFMNNVHVCVISQRSSIIEVGRCEIAAVALQTGAEKLLTLDSDMTFPPNTLIELIRKNKDIICCDAKRRRPPYTSVLCDTEGKPLDHSIRLPALVEVAGGSSACQLVDLNVFRKIKEPYYKVEFNDKKEFLGEDYYFSNKVRKAGYAVFCDTVLSKQIGHIGVKEHKIGE